LLLGKDGLDPLEIAFGYPFSFRLFLQPEIEAEGE